jgi:hypothetical protein
MARMYRVVLASTRSGLVVAADEDWQIEEASVREFAELDSNDDLSFENPGRLLVRNAGWVALAFRDF